MVRKGSKFMETLARIIDKWTNFFGKRRGREGGEQFSLTKRLITLVENLFSRKHRAVWIFPLAEFKYYWLWNYISGRARGFNNAGIVWLGQAKRGQQFFAHQKFLKPESEENVTTYLGLTILKNDRPALPLPKSTVSFLPVHTYGYVFQLRRISV